MNRELPVRLAALASALQRRFLGKDETIRLLLLCAVAGEHALLVGPPGTAKSALLREFAQLLHAEYFEYLLTRFTEPNELFGPVDLGAFREGRYERRIEGMLPAAEVVFLDEIFKSSSAILNTLLTLLNERMFHSGGKVLHTPLLLCVAASNEVPADGALDAVFDRFLLRIRSEPLDAMQFHALLRRGLEREFGSSGASSGSSGASTNLGAPVRASELLALQQRFGQQVKFSDAFLDGYKQLVFQIRAEGVTLSDRRAVKLLKLFAASAWLDGRDEPHAGDFYILKYIWNQPEQELLLERIVEPMLQAFAREQPEAVLSRHALDVPQIVAELERVRLVLSTGGALSDIQLLSQLRVLGELKRALHSSADVAAPQLLERIEHMLQSVFRGSRFGSL